MRLPVCCAAIISFCLLRGERITGLQPPNLPSRRQALATAVVTITGGSALLQPRVVAAASTVNDELAQLQQATDQACTVLEEALSRSDYTALLTLTREYDLVLRKAGMGSIKKAYSPTDVATDPTVLTNAVTFDLIGINKNARKGSENAEGVAKYISELRTDIGKFVALYKEG